MQKNEATVSARDLRTFGFIFAGILIFLFGMLLPYVKHHTFDVWPFYIGIPVALLAIVWPAALRPFYVVWTKFGMVLGAVNTRIIMSVFFFVFITPVAWIMKLAGRDPLARKLEKSEKSYRVASAPYIKEHMEKPY